jgi:arylsulfatase A-like enzyme
MKPNIILIVMDAVRYDHLSCYGYSRPTTPNLDQLAEDGVLFENCFAAAAWTPPSHASLFTGKYPSQCGVIGKNLVLDNSHMTIAEFLRQRGYRTGATGSAWISRSLGFDYGFEEFAESWRRVSWKTLSRGQLSMTTSKAYQKMRDRILRCEEGGDRVVLQWFKQWVGNQDREKPFFAFLRFLSAHAPYYPLPAFKRRFEPSLNHTDDMKKLRHLAKLGGYSYIAKRLSVSEREWEIVKAWYDSCILYVDHLIGELVDWLRQRDLLESTIIMVLSDHGENFGEHGMAYHVYCVYDTLLHVPLIVRGPKDLIPSGVQVRDLVSVVDIFPSIVDLLEPGAELEADLAGNSFLPIHNLPVRDRIFAEYGHPKSMRALELLHPDFQVEALRHAYKTIRTSSFKYILRSDGRAELFDVANDPGETVNVHDQYLQHATELHGSLQARLGSFLGTDSGLELDEEEALSAHLRSLGYL